MQARTASSSQRRSRAVISTSAVRLRKASAYVSSMSAFAMDRSSRGNPETLGAKPSVSKEKPPGESS